MLTRLGFVLGSPSVLFCSKISSGDHIASLAQDNFSPSLFFMNLMSWKSKGRALCGLSLSLGLSDVLWRQSWGCGLRKNRREGGPLVHPVRGTRRPLTVPAEVKLD